MKVFVTGGTGAIGRFVVPALHDAGHEVTALTRSDDKAAWLEGAGAHPVEVSLFDVDALTNAFAGRDAVANLATAIPRTKDAWKAVYAPGPVWASSLSVDERAGTESTDERAGK